MGIHNPAELPWTLSSYSLTVGIFIMITCMDALFGSIFAQLVWWPWAHWILAFVCAFLAIMAVFTIPEG
jgi:hypothetical protein